MGRADCACTDLRFRGPAPRRQSDRTGYARQSFSTRALGKPVRSWLPGGIQRRRNAVSDAVGHARDRSFVAQGLVPIAAGAVHARRTKALGIP